MSDTTLYPPQPHNVSPGERLVRIETKLDLLAMQFAAATADQETRLRKVEGRVTALFGGGTLLASAFGLLVTALTLFDFTSKG